MTAAERFVKRMLGGISSSQYMGNGEGGGNANVLPESQDLAKHDEHYHPDGYNPQTDDCSLRDGVEAKLTESVDADILEGKKDKPTVTPTETPTEKPPETRAEVMERLGKAHNVWSSGEAIQPWVEKLSDEDLKKYADLLDSVVNGNGEAEPLLQFEEQKNNEYVGQNQTGAEQSANPEEEYYEKKPQSIAEHLSESFVKFGAEDAQRKFSEHQKKEQEKKEAVARYLESGDEIELEIAGKKSIELDDDKVLGFSREDVEKGLAELEERLTADRNAVTLKDINATIKQLRLNDKIKDLASEGTKYWGKPKDFDIDVRRKLKELVAPREEWQNSASYDQRDAKRYLEVIGDLQIPETIRKQLENVASGDVSRLYDFHRAKKGFESIDREKAKEQEKANAKKQEMLRMARRELEYQKQRTAAGIANSEKGAKELGIPEWIYNLLDSWDFPRQRAGKESFAKDFKDGKSCTIRLDKDSKSNGTMIFGDCPQWFTALTRMKGFLYRPLNAYMYSMTGDRTHTMRFQGFENSMKIDKGKVTLHLTPHCMVTDGWNDTTDSENRFISALRDSGMDATLGLNGDIEIGIDENGVPKKPKQMRFRDFTKAEDRLTEAEVQEIVDGERSVPDNANIFIDSVYRGGDTEYPDIAKKMLGDDLIPITTGLTNHKMAKFVNATKSVMKRFPAYSKIMGEICAGVGEFEDGYVNGEVKCARFKDGRQLAPCLIFSGARRPNVGVFIPTPARIAERKRKAEEEKKKFRWKSTANAVPSYARSAEEYMDAVLVHELGHVYFNREQNGNDFEKALLSTISEGKRESAQKITRETKLSESQFPWLMYVSEYAKTNMNELHSECLAMCSLPNYEKGVLPQAIEDYCFSVLNGNFEKAEK